MNLRHLYHRIVGYIRPFDTKDAVFTVTSQYKPSYLELLSQWHSIEALDERRIIPYGIPREIYFNMLSSDYFDRPITLYPEHVEYAR